MNSPGSSNMVGEGLRQLASPLKRPLRAPKMAKLELNQGEDDLNQVDIKDFIKQTKRS